ncbi:MAG TPA: hypothetical protein VGL34_07075 [Steroidobacteraceae bacterium]|jgi:hypothetical protein
MSESKDFVVYNMPGMLSRRVTRQDPIDPKNRVPDESWYNSVCEKMAVLFAFYTKHSLIGDPRLLRDVDKVVVKFSDFSSLGQKFIMSGASDRWLAAFDRPGSQKELSDVRYLEKQLSNIKMV